MKPDEKETRKDKEVQKTKEQEKVIEEIYYNTDSIASANEFTGLIPSAVETECESDSYSDEFNIHEQAKVNFGNEKEVLKKRINNKIP